MSTAALVRPNNSPIQLDFSTGSTPWSASAPAVVPEKKILEFPLPPKSVPDHDNHSSPDPEENRLACEGPIQSITMPPGWILAGRHSSKNGSRKLEIFRPRVDPWCQIDVYYRGQPTTKAAADCFKRLLQSKPANFRAEVLMPREIRELSEVIGASTIGNNQFTNNEPAGTKSSPDFHLRSAHTVKINGKTVLAIHGDFIEPLDPTRKPINSYEGIFIDGGIDYNTGGRKIQEVFLQGPASRISHYRTPFNFALNSIKWLNNLPTEYCITAAYPTID